MAVKKVQIEKITILWSEVTSETNLSFDSWEDANDKVKSIAKTAHIRFGFKKWGQSKTKYQIVWKDGQEWIGRMEASNDRNSMGQRILDHLLFTAGLSKPEHMTKKQYLEVINPSAHQACVDFMNKYEILP